MRGIYVITVMSRVQRDSLGYPAFGATRTVGYYLSKNEAELAVTNNAGDMREGCYNYALIEQIKPGIYQSASPENRWWFKFNDEKEQYEPIDEPEFLNNMSGFFIG